MSYDWLEKILIGFSMLLMSFLLIMLLSIYLEDKRPGLYLKKDDWSCSKTDVKVLSFSNIPVYLKECVQWSKK